MCGGCGASRADMRQPDQGGGCRAAAPERAIDAARETHARARAPDQTASQGGRERGHAGPAQGRPPAPRRRRERPGDAHRTAGRPRAARATPGRAAPPARDAPPAAGDERRPRPPASGRRAQRATTPLGRKAPGHPQPGAPRQLGERPAPPGAPTRQGHPVRSTSAGCPITCRPNCGFEADLSNNLYKLWNRMCSGSYFPPPVRRVEIPKADGGMRRWEFRRLQTALPRRSPAVIWSRVLSRCSIPTPMATDPAALQSMPCARHASAAGGLTGCLTST